ncbi:MAG: hypothetical protein HY300_00715, partial [Verrucomicrobia bacterium]|nr:hypothetical protein [Verrucomicrobiota bacterium]
MVTNNWDRLLGGNNDWRQSSTNRSFADGYPFQWGDSTSDANTVWPAWPDAGTETDSATYSGTDTNAVANQNWSLTYSNMAQPSWPWQHYSCQYASSDSGDPNDAYVQWSSDYSFTATWDAQIELWTGGTPGSTNQVFITLGVSMTDLDTGLPIDPSEITLMGMTPDTNGIVTITNTENLFIGCTPTVDTTVHTNYEFSVWIAPAPPGGGSNTVTIAKMQYMDPDLPGTWLDVTGTIYSYQNDTYQFRVLPSPTNATWPSGSPTWKVAGAAAGTGAQITYQFSALSSSATDYKQVVATCGTSSRTSSVVVFTANLAMHPEDDFTNRTYSHYLVGERLVIVNNISPADLSPLTPNLDLRTNYFPYPARFDVLSDKTSGTLYGVAIPGLYKIELVRHNSAAGITRVLQVFPATFVPPNYLKYEPWLLLGQTPNTYSAVVVGTTNVPTSSTSIGHTNNTHTALLWF